MPELDAERRLARFFDDYVDAGRPGAVHLLRSPRTALRFLRDVRAIPVLVAAPSRTVDGRAVRAGLERPTYRLRMTWQRLTAVLEIPSRPEEYLLGGAKHLLRRRMRIGERAGLTWRPVPDPVERRTLLDRADRFEREQARAVGLHVDPRNDDTLPVRLWLVAESSTGEPLLLAVAAVDGEWAVLRYFRALSALPEAKEARYWLMPVVVAQLGALGVRHVADTVSPGNLPNGLRHFQRSVGFRYVDVRLRRASPTLDRIDAYLERDTSDPHDGAVLPTIEDRA